MDQHAKSVWMKQLLGRLESCHDQWQTAAGATELYLARAMKRDLGELRRVCQSMRRDVLTGSAS